MKQIGDWTVFNYEQEWDTFHTDKRLYHAINFKEQQYGYSNKYFTIDTTDTIHSIDSKGRAFMTWTKSVKSVREVLEPLWRYSQRCAQNDSNTIGRWYGPGMCAIRIFKHKDKYYELWYWADGTGEYHEVSLETVSNGIKVKPVYSNPEKEAVSAHHYKLIDFDNNYMLKLYIGKWNPNIDDTFYHVGCYKYCEAITDSMFYYGYDTLVPGFEKREPYMIRIGE